MEVEFERMTMELTDVARLRHIILIPDSFKGNLSSTTICETMAEVILRHAPSTLITSIPVADGGEGSVDAFLAAMGGERISLTVQGPFGEPVESFYGILPDGTAVIEMAAAAGLPLAGDRNDVARATTFGVGQLMKDALDRDCRKLIIGLGGSSTNDGGCGAAAALGVLFKNREGTGFVPTGKTLREIAEIDVSGLDPRLLMTDVVTMCDIDNPLTGKEGAAAVFGPQKGADPALVTYLDEGLSHLAGIIRDDLGLDIEHLPGAGAAGGMGGGTVAFFGAALEMGIDVVLETVGFDHLLQTADFVFTGEGKIDTQSLRGKVVIGVARRAVRQSVPVVAFVGDIGDHIEAAYDEGVSAIFSINRVAVPFAEAKGRAKSDLDLTVDNVMRFLTRLGHF